MKVLKLYLEIIAVMLTSSLSNCFISKERDKMFSLGNQNNGMKSKGADEGKDALSRVL